MGNQRHPVEVGVVRPGTMMISRLESAGAAPCTGYTSEELLTLGCPADFEPLFELESLYIPDDGAIALCTEANRELSSAIKVLLERQGVWGEQDGCLIKQIQPIAMSMLNNSPQWMSKEEFLLATQLGFVKSSPDSELGIEFRQCLARRLVHLLPLVKASLEPASDSQQSYELTLAWLRERVCDLTPALLVEVMDAAVRTSEPLGTAAERVKMLLTGKENVLQILPQHEQTGELEARLSLRFPEGYEHLDIEAITIRAELLGEAAEHWDATGALVGEQLLQVLTNGGITNDEDLIESMQYKPLTRFNTLPDLVIMECFAPGSVRAEMMIVGGGPKPDQAPASEQPDVAQIEMGMADYAATNETGLHKASDVLTIGRLEDWKWLDQLESIYLDAKASKSIGVKELI